MKHGLVKIRIKIRVKVIQFLQEQIVSVNDDSFTICITGDFNFPRINWKNGLITPGGSSDESSSAKSLLQFMADNLYGQYVLCPTRKKNTLDLFITNDDRLVVDASATETPLSDHDLVDVMLSENPQSEVKSNVPKFDQDNFRSLDFHNADIERLKTMLGDVDWKTLRSHCSFEEFPIVFTDTLLQIFLICCPRKKISNGRPKALNALRRKKKRVLARYNALLSKSHSNSEHVAALQSKLALICYEIKDEINKSLDRKEALALSRIKANPKYFFSYAKSLSKVKSSISMLVTSDDSITNNPSKMADILQNQFTSVFSDPNAPNVKAPDFDVPSIKEQSNELGFYMTDEQAIAAIDKISSNAASGPDGVPVTLLKTCSRELCQPIKLIWAESFAKKEIPSFYKQTCISPIYKSGNRTEFINYRPIALTSHIIKIYERYLREVMVKFIEHNELLCNSQHGFVSGKSCLTQLLSHFDDIYEGLLAGADTDAIYLDYAKAFDKVDHQLLLKKLRRYGFNERLISWIQSFLAERYQQVVINGESSYSAKVHSGVPQGSVLGPLLFILFINDMESCVKHSTIRFFADDTRILKHINSYLDVYLLQQDLNSVMKWAGENNMTLHEDKFEYIVHRHSPNSLILQLPFISELFVYTVSSGRQLRPVSELKDLGVTVSSTLSWSLQVNKMATKARAIASWALSAFKARDKTTMLTLYKSLVRSQLEYCCPLWNCHKVTDIQVLEGVQKTFTSRIWGLQHLDYWQRLKALKIMSLQRRRERYLLIHMWKILNGCSPNDIDIKFCDPSRKGVRAKVPSLCKSSSLRNQSLYDHSFAVQGPRLWNTIPAHLHQLTEPATFKSALTKYLLTIPDTPPVVGYVGANSNSLLDWSINKAVTGLQGWSQQMA